MTNTQIVFVTLLFAQAISGCSKPSEAQPADCANPKFLYAKVGKTVFRLPKSVQIPNSIVMDEKRTDEKLGVIKLRYEEYRSDPRNRIECNRKEIPIADFRTEMGFVFEGDGSEPPDYRMGKKMHALIGIYAFDPASSSRARSDYLADAAHIDQVRFIGRTDHPRRGVEPTASASFVFAYRDRRFDVECQVGSYSGTHLQPLAPQLCRHAAFRAEDILISTNQRTSRLADGRQILIPPDEWPRQWKFIIAKVLDFRTSEGAVMAQKVADSGPRP